MTETKNTDTAPINFILRCAFKLVPKEVRRAVGRIWRTRFGLRPDPLQPPPAPKSYGFSNAAKEALLASGINPDDEDEVRAIRERRRTRAK